MKRKKRKRTNKISENQDYIHAINTFIYLRSQQVAFPGRGIFTQPFMCREDAGMLSPFRLLASWPKTLPKCSAKPTGNPHVLGKWGAHLVCAEAPHSWQTETWRPKWMESRQTEQFVARMTICDCSRCGILWCIRWLANPVLLVEGEDCWNITLKH